MLLKYKFYVKIITYCGIELKRYILYVNLHNYICLYYITLCTGLSFLFLTTWSTFLFIGLKDCFLVAFSYMRTQSDMVVPLQSLHISE